VITRNPTARAKPRSMFAMRRGLGHGAGFRTPSDLMIEQAIWAARRDNGSNAKYLVIEHLQSNPLPEWKWTWDKNKGGK
jgi:hypothetical protein